MNLPVPVYDNAVSARPEDLGVDVAPGIRDERQCGRPVHRPRLK